MRSSPDRIRFTVLDDGPGIPVAERERIFERFHRTDPARARSAGGAGLGLAIVRAIAEAHGGTVRARDPEDGRGARVEFVLPGFAPAATARRVRRDSLSAPAATQRVTDRVEPRDAELVDEQT